MSKIILTLIALKITFCSFSQSIGTVKQEGVPDTSSYGKPADSTVDIQAAFRGGNKAWNKFLGDNLNANVGVENSAKTGTYNVVIQFTVTEKGELKDFKPLTKYGHGFEEEVIRVLKLSPPWIPGIKDGKMVSSVTKYKQVFNITGG